MLAVDVEDSFDEVLETANGSIYSRIPVYEDTIDNIIGILHLNHFYKELSTGRKNFDIREILMPVNFVHKTMPLDDVLREMKKRKCHMVIVTDEYGGTMGCLTMEDVLEQLVGDIWDETDEVVEEFVQTGDDTFEADGDMRIEDFFYNLDIDDRDFDDDNITLGGWAIEMLGDYPKVGDSFEYRNLTVTVKKLQNRRVVRLSVKVWPEPELDEEEGL
jgi:CBS domain containing-hemolysin-like protein